jgi:threonyl-tRNA synthetase
MGCYERTLALLLEKYAGALPMWLSPTQATVIPVNADMNAYAAEVAAKMEACGIRVNLDDRNETMGKRIREAQLEKIPYMLIVGAKEQADNAVSVRNRKGEDLGVMSVSDMLVKFMTEINEKVK